jgi:hypothetical protein
MTDETQVTDAAVENDAVVETPQVEESKVHPAWDKMLAELPEVLHAKVTPFLQEQDRNFQQQLEKYTPYKDFIEQGITPDVLSGGVNLVRAIEESPVDVFNSLKEYLGEQGMLPKEAAAAAKDIMEGESGEDIEDIFDESEVPAALKKELKDLRDKQAEFENYASQQELEKATQVELQNIEREMADLKAKYSISEAHETSIYNLMNAALNAGQDITLEQAAKQLADMVGGFRPAVAPGSAAPAPTVVGSAGGAGVPSPEISFPKSDKEKREALAQMFEEYRKANQ